MLRAWNVPCYQPLPSLGKWSVLLACLVSATDRAAESSPTGVRQYEQTVSKAIDFLMAKGRAEDGSFSGFAGPGVTAEGGLRSYGSMSYAGLKSMIYAGVGPDDPRVKAAIKWIGKHYDLTSNPGMGNAGLYYYYHTFAKALDAMRYDVFVDEQGVRHDWRGELRAELARRQQPDGSWVNHNDRWLEGDPNLVTGYALLTLSYCKPKDTDPQ